MADLRETQQKEQSGYLGSRVIIKGHNHYGIFQPHSVNLDDPHGRLWQSQAINLKYHVQQFISQQKPVVFCLEHGAQDRQNETRNIRHLLRYGQPRSNKDNDWKRELDDLLLMTRMSKDASDGYKFLIYSLFKRQQAKFGNENVYGILEDPPAINLPYVSTKIIMSPLAPMNVRMQAFIDTISYLMARDLHYARQINKEVHQGDKSKAAVIIRGTGHIGLAPAINALNRAQGRNTDFRPDTALPIRIVESGNGNYLPVAYALLWQENIWEDFINGAGISASTNDWDRSLVRFHKRTKERLATPEFTPYMEGVIHNWDTRRGERLLLTQNMKLS